MCAPTRTVSCLKAQVKEWERRHPAGSEASQYQHLGVYEVPVGL